MTQDEILALKRGDRIRVKRATRSRFMTAVVTERPRTVGRWVLVGYAYATGEPGREHLRRLDHYAQVPGDQIERWA